MGTDRATRRPTALRGDVPAIESAHAIAGAVQLAAEMGPEAIILVNLSGRGDKDVQQAAEFIFGGMG